MSNVPKLKIDSSFFNKLDSLHKSKSKKANTNTQHKSKSFGNTSLSVINNKQKIKKSPPKIIKQESNSEPHSEFEIIEKKKIKLLLIIIQNKKYYQRKIIV